MFVSLMNSPLDAAAVVTGDGPGGAVAPARRVGLVAPVATSEVVPRPVTNLGPVHAVLDALAAGAAHQSLRAGLGSYLVISRHCLQDSVLSSSVLVHCTETQDTVVKTVS